VKATCQKNSDQNGLFGDFIQINLAQEHEAELDVRFVDSSITESLSYVTVDSFEFTLFDIDQGPKGGQESYTIDKYEKYEVLEGHEFNISDPDDGSGASIVSSHFGGACDNPSDHLDVGDVVCKNGKKEVTINKAMRAVLFEFRNATGFKLTFKVGGDFDGGTATGARNVLLGGATPTLCLAD